MYQVIIITTITSPIQPLDQLDDHQKQPAAAAAEEKTCLAYYNSSSILFCSVNGLGQPRKWGFLIQRNLSAVSNAEVTPESDWLVNDSSRMRTIPIISSMRTHLTTATDGRSLKHWVRQIIGNLMRAEEEEEWLLLLYYSFSPVPTTTKRHKFCSSERVTSI